MPHEEEDLQLGRLPEPPEELDRIARSVIGAAIEVHKVIGPGASEEVYERGLAHELMLRGHHVDRQHRVEFACKGVLVGWGRVDLLVDHLLVVEVKAVEMVIPLHKKQVQTYLKALDQMVGLLLNFNVPIMRKGIFRILRHQVFDVREL